MRFLKTILLLVIEEFTVKADEDIEKGEVVYNDGNGILAASAGDAADTDIEAAVWVGKR